LMSKHLTAARGTKAIFRVTMPNRSCVRMIPLAGNSQQETKGFVETHKREGKEGAMLKLIAAAIVVLAIGVAATAAFADCGAAHNSPPTPEVQTPPTDASS